MIDEKKLIKELSRNSIFKKVTVGEETVYDVIERLPKVGEWIPVSERLPETDNEHTHKFDVLCYVPKVDENIQHGIYIGKLKFTKGDYDGSSNFWGIKTKDCEWTLWGWSYFEHPTVVAWMPLPKPYEGI